MKDNMYYGVGHLIFQRAAELRNRMTPAEQILWQYLHINEWKLKFRRQHPIWQYIADFYCHKLKLVIELDGSIHDLDAVRENDIRREKYLRDFGITVLRFNNTDIFKNISFVIEKIAETVQQLTSPPSGAGATLTIVKIGGNIIDDEQKLSDFIKNFAAIKGKKILIHGGGKLATRLAETMGVEQQMIDGRRITDAETLKIVTMVYAGYINKNVVAALQAHGCNAIGLSGADGNAIEAHKRKHASIDYGFVGDVDRVNVTLLDVLLQQNLAIVFAPITHDKHGILLNTNADTIAQEIAKAMSGNYDVSLIYSFEKAGVLLDANDDNTVINEINPSYYTELKTEGKIFAGMLPKLDNAFAAINSGVKKVIIGKAEQLPLLTEGKAGTTIIA